jgi:hypothetical protein
MPQRRERGGPAPASRRALEFLRARPKRSSMMAKSKAKSSFAGLWHIVSMSGWDEDYFNEEVQAFIEFEENGTGHFQFGYVQVVSRYCCAIRKTPRTPLGH